MLNGGGRRHAKSGIRSLASSSASSFEAPEPPKSQGQPVFSDIQFHSNISSDLEHAATKRNNDDEAVFVVTAGNRGIGLQFVKSLLERTKVRQETNLLSL